SIPGDCEPASGSHFEVGTWPVVCNATDGAGHTGTAGFDVIVSFDQPPTDQPPTLNLPSVPDVHTTNPGGTQVIYSATANDQEDGALTPTCTPASGSTFSVGTTTVGCSVADSGGHTVTGSFDVTVILDSAPPPKSRSRPAMQAETWPPPKRDSPSSRCRRRGRRPLRCRRRPTARRPTT